MRIQMMETRMGSEDGFRVKQYHAGCIYEVHRDMAQTLASRFLRNKWAVVVRPVPVAVTIMLADLRNLSSICSTKGEMQ